MTNQAREAAEHGLDRVIGLPESPSTYYLEERNRVFQQKAAEFPGLTSPYSGAHPETIKAISRARDQIADELYALSDDIFQFREEAFQERKSSEAILRLLAKHGIEGKQGLGSLDTAFQARLLDGTPEPASADGLTWDAEHGDERRIAILAEYDALPEIGHGCGHNTIAASSVGAFLALKIAAEHLPDEIREQDFKGVVALIGTPAEEGNSGKETIAREGFFQGIHAAEMAHPSSVDSAGLGILGRRIVDITYHGVPAHAAAMPYQGRNALDAVALHYEAVGLLRQQLYPEDRIHGNILEGGDRPSIIPKQATIRYYVRSPRIQTLRELSQRVDNISRGIALATGTGVTVNWDPRPASFPVRQNSVLGARFAQHERSEGRIVYDQATLPSGIAGSTDFGNISQRLPGVHPTFKIAPADVSAHTPEFGQYAHGEQGRKGIHDASYGLAAVAADWLADKAIRDAVQEEFDRDGGSIDVERIFG
ncbi:amidohydrolase [Bifidobacterium sp. UTBIF-78]|uniref:amidohydrolase n=1 Tax=Bifidobacterium sp. UTBIF-78 TaxID=1465263 RepID=UPI00112993C7|nr:amidohydrolase [Bifidobacterium sp. UTBIF-78]TPF91880.1 hypothetical protein BG22_10345 [Bifidobacterium sp. UTBIF-78]